jgi:hypothetical protein
MIQDAFSNLNADEREFIKTGLTPELWDTVLGTIEIEDEHGDWEDTPSEWYCITNKTGYDAEYEAQADGIVIYKDEDRSDTVY